MTCKRPARTASGVSQGPPPPHSDLNAPAVPPSLNPLKNAPKNAGAVLAKLSHAVESARRSALERGGWALRQGHSRPATVDRKKHVVGHNERLPALPLHPVLSILVVTERLRDREVDEPERERRPRVQEEVICSACSRRQRRLILPAFSNFVLHTHRLPGTGCQLGARALGSW